MKTITITESMMKYLISCVVDEGNTTHKDKGSGVVTVEHKNQEYWLSVDGLDDGYFVFDATWKGVEDGEDSEAVGEWTYSIKAGDVVEYITNDNPFSTGYSVHLLKRITHQLSTLSSILHPVKNYRGKQNE